MPASDFKSLQRCFFINAYGHQLMDIVLLGPLDDGFPVRLKSSVIQVAMAVE
jgi:hypothetical protein